MSFYPIRRIPTPNVSPLGLYIKGMFRTFLVLLLFLLGGVMYAFDINQGVYYYSFGVLIALITGVFLGGFTSGKTDKGWFFGLLIGLTYGLFSVALEDFLFAGYLGGLDVMKLPFILAITGTLGGSIGYRIRLTKIRYNIRRRGIIN